MSIIRRRNHEVPSLNTASLPDLIFAILFFFMIVTHMRKVNLKVRYKTPQGTELTHLSRKTNTTYIFIGQPVDTTQAANTAQFLGSAQSQQDAAVCIQVN
ncbi:MAG: biopolymer transporter ExbD, partial [Prevotella sp.]|nr:biopolymer transporter ExbD [Prevotella sp.]